MSSRAFRPVLLVALALIAGTLVPAAGAPLEVPVVYTFTQAGKSVEGVLTGGSLCAEEGLSLKDSTATISRVVPYTTVERLENISMLGGAKLLMHVVLKDGNRFQAYADVPAADPLLIFRDELPEGATGTPKLRTFTRANFKGIHQISFEAEDEVDMSPEEAQTLIAELGQAVGQGDLDKAIDLHNQVGDFIEAWQSAANQEDGEGTASGTASGDDAGDDSDD